MNNSDRLHFETGAAASVAGGLPAAQAVRAGELLLISGQVSVGPDGELRHPGDVAAQARHVFGAISSLVEQAGGTLADIVEIVSFHSDPRDMDAVFDVAREFFSEADGLPAWTPVGYIGSLVPGALVMVRAVAHLGEGPKTSYAPQGWEVPAGIPGAAACTRGGLVFIAGQTAMNRDGRVPVPLDHNQQAREAYDRILGVLAKAGGGVDDILDFSSFHHDIRGARSTIEEIYIPQIMGAIDTDDAATTSHLGSTGLYRDGVLGAYTALADLTPGKRQGSTPDVIWWKGVYPIAGATRKPGGHVVTIAGQVSSAPDGSILHPGDVERQARFIFDSIRETLNGFGLSMDDVVDVRSFHKDARWGDVVARVGRDYFSESARPAWTYAAVPGLWFEGYQHEIAAIAYAP